MASFGKKVNKSNKVKRGNRDVVKKDTVILSSAIYTAKVNQAYIFETKSGANFAKIELEADGKRLFFNECFQSGDEKGNKTFYTDKDGNDNDLPGYALLNEVLASVMGEDILNSELEDDVKIMDIFDLFADEQVVVKSIPIYSFKDRKDINTKVPVIECLIGKEVKLGVLEAFVDIPQKVDGMYVYENGNAVPSGKAKKVNIIDKFFNIDSGCTFSEFIEAKDATFYKKWNEGYKDTVQDHTENSIAPKPGDATATADGTQSVDSLFKGK